MLTGALLPILAQLRSSELSLQVQGAAAIRKLADDNQQGRDAVVSAGECCRQTICLTLSVSACDQKLQLNIVECLKKYVDGHAMSMHIQTMSRKNQEACEHIAWLQARCPS